MQVEERENGSVWIGQSAYVTAILDRFRMTDCRPNQIPMDVGNLIQKAGPGAKMVDATLYQSAIGSLLYLAGATRPDISFAVHKMAQFSCAPSVTHWELVKKIFRYLQGTKTLGLLYRPDGEHRLEVYADSDMSGNYDDGKSTSGYVLMKAGAAISWKSKKQTCVAQSTAEAEFVALYFAAQEATWMREVLRDLKENHLRPIVIHEDNQSCIAKVRNPPINHGLTKHIARRYHFTRDEVENGQLEVVYCPTERQLADCFTKPLSPD